MSETRELTGEARLEPETRSGRLLERMLLAYSRHFDIRRDVLLGGRPVEAMASFYSRGERYVLTRKAKLWAMECNEHVAFFTPQILDREGLETVTRMLEAAEGELVKPHSEHMYTYLSAVILADTLSADTARLIRRYRWRRSYRFSFHGWCQVRLAVAELSTGRIFTNFDGRVMKKALAGQLS